MSLPVTFGRPSRTIESRSCSSAACHLRHMMTDGMNRRAISVACSPTGRGAGFSRADLDDRAGRRRSVMPM